MADELVITTLPRPNGEELRVSVTEFRGTRFVDVRTFAAHAAGGALLPTRKGVALKVQDLDQMIEALQQAKAECERGASVVVDVRRRQYVD